MTLGEHVLSIAAAGLAFSDSPTADNRLTILLNIEDMLDKGRGNATLEERAAINEKMDQLRATIRDLLDALPTAEAEEFMIARGRQAQNQFTIKAQ